MTEIKNKKLYYAKQRILMVLFRELTSLVLVSEGGLGKSWLTMKTVKEHLKSGEYVYWVGHISSFERYKLLCENPDKIIIFDDAESAFKNDVCVDILKSALWAVDGKRIVCYRTKADLQGDYPTSFEFKGGIILLCNKIPRRESPVVQALTSRTSFYMFTLTYDEKIAIMNDIIDEHENLDTLGRKIIKEQLARLTSVCTKNFNLRTLEKLIIFYNHNIIHVKDDENLYVELFKGDVEIDENKALVKQLMEKNCSVRQQCKLFCEQTGLAPATYFRVKKELIKDLGGKKYQNITKKG